MQTYRNEQTDTEWAGSNLGDHGKAADQNVGPFRRIQSRIVKKQLNLFLSGKKVK